MFSLAFLVVDVDGSEILRENHLGCIKPCEEWDKLPTSTGAGFLNHQQYPDVVKVFLRKSPQFFLQGSDLQMKKWLSKLMIWEGKNNDEN